jgi:hypothetical protein
MAAKYLFDSNTFFQSKNREYRFEFASEFWDWIITAHKHQMVYSVQKVLDEINAGANTCPAKAWAANLPPGFFLPDTKEAAVMKSYATLMQWGAGQNHYTAKARSDFADPKDADAFLIATAMGNGMVICTHETSDPVCKRRIPLPDAATAHGVKTIHIFDVLTAHASSPFKFKP